MKLLWKLAYAKRGVDLPYDVALANFLLGVEEYLSPSKKRNRATH